MAHVWCWDLADEVTAVLTGDCHWLVVLAVDKCAKLRK